MDKNDRLSLQFYFISFIPLMYSKPSWYTKKEELDKVLNVEVLSFRKIKKN